MWFVYGKFKFMNFGTTLNLLQVKKNFISNEALADFKDNFSNFRKVLTDDNPLYFLTKSYIMFPYFQTNITKVTNFRNNTTFFIL